MRFRRIGSRSALVLSLMCATTVAAQPASGPAAVVLDPLMIELVTDRAAYLPLEPVRVSVRLRSGTHEPYRVVSRPDETFIAIDVTRSAPSSIPRRIESWTLPPPSDPDDDTAPTTSHLNIGYVDGPTWTTWYVDHLPVGVTTFRARALIMLGPDAGTAVYSDYVPVVIQEPRGTDLDAYEFMTNTTTVTVDEATWYGGHSSWGLWYEDALRSDLPKYEYFVDRFGHSRYADYVRFSIGSLLGARRDRSLESWRALIDHAPDDFPLLARSYGHALQYHRARRDWPAMHALIVHARHREPGAWRRAPEATALTMWEDALTPWPPPRRQDGERLERAARARNLADRAARHWTARTLDERYGAGRSTRVTTGRTVFAYLDTPSRVPLHLSVTPGPGDSEADVTIEGMAADVRLAFPEFGRGLPLPENGRAVPVRGRAEGSRLVLEQFIGGAWVHVDAIATGAEPSP